MSNTISWEDFEKVDIRAGTIVRAAPFPEARKQAYKVWVDFGPAMGIKQSSAQITEIYDHGELTGLQVICVTNLEPKMVAGFKSEVLITGFILDSGKVVLARSERKVPNGSKLM